MNLKRLLGLDTLSEKYSYAEDPVYGYTAAEKIPDHWVATTCGYCSVGCGMYIGVRDGKPVAARGNPDHPVNRGKLCPKGLSEHYMITAANRARYPMLQREGKASRVTWQAAFREMATQFRAVQEKYGNNSVGIISTGQLVTEEFYALGKLAHLGLGTKNYCGNTTLCMASAVSGYKRSFGSDGPPGAYEDLEKADVVFLIGANIADNHPILCSHLQRNADATVMVADPRVTKTAMLSDLHLPLKPRTDIALINGIAHIILRAGLVNEDYVNRHTTGFDALNTHLDAWTPERTSEITGLSQELIYRAALLYGRAKAPFIGWTMGVNHSTQGTGTVNAINNLALLTGNIGRPGASPFSITGQCNAMGTREVGATSSLPGYRKFESESDRAELAALWNAPLEAIPASRGLAYPDIIEAAVAGKIRALWIIATNPAVSYPNYGVLKQALESVDFLVVQDGFYPTPTSAFAHLALPAAIWGEKEGVYTNSERRCSKVNRAVAPPGEAFSDFDIFLGLADELGCRGRIFPGWTKPRDAFEEWRKVSRGRLCDYSGMTYERIEQQNGIQWPCAEGQSTGTPRLYSDGVYQHPDGKARLIPVDWEPFPDQPTRTFPLVLNTGRTVEHWHTRTKTENVPILEKLSPRAWLEMNPRDAGKLGLKPHDLVDVVSKRSAVSGVELRITEIVAPGQVFMPFHYAEANSNLVTQSAFDPISREPNYKQCAVRVEPAARGGAAS